jgi:hypothetical protein
MKEIRVLICGESGVSKLKAMGVREVSKFYIYTMHYNGYDLWFRCSMRLCFPPSTGKKIHLIQLARPIV